MNKNIRSQMTGGPFHETNCRCGWTNKKNQTGNRIKG